MFFIAVLLPFLVSASATPINLFVNGDFENTFLDSYIATDPSIPSNYPPGSYWSSDDQCVNKMGIVPYPGAPSAPTVNLCDPNFSAPSDLSYVIPIGWHEFNVMTHPRTALYSSCRPSVFPYVMPPQGPHGGQGFGAIDLFNRPLICQGNPLPFADGTSAKILSTLEAGMQYEVSFWYAKGVRQGHSLNDVPNVNVQVIRSRTGDNDSWDFLQANQWQSGAVPGYLDSPQWKYYSALFTAAGWENYIGFISDLTQPQSPIQPGDIPPTLYIDDAVLKCNTTRTIPVPLYSLPGAPAGATIQDLTVTDLTQDQTTTFLWTASIPYTDPQKFEFRVTTNGVTTAFPYARFSTAFQNANGKVLALLTALGYSIVLGQEYSLELFYDARGCEGYWLPVGKINLHLQCSPTEALLETAYVPMLTLPEVRARVLSSQITFDSLHEDHEFDLRLLQPGMVIDPSRLSLRVTYNGVDLTFTYAQFFQKYQDAHHLFKAFIEALLSTEIKYGDQFTLSLHYTEQCLSKNLDAGTLQVSVASESLAGDFSVFPNPVIFYGPSTSLTLRFSDSIHAYSGNYKIIEASGKLVRSGTFSLLDSQDVSVAVDGNWASGSYFIEVKMDGAPKKQRMIKPFIFLNDPQ